MTIGNHLVERKWLKEGFIVTHQIKFITWVNQQIHFKGVSRMILGERSLLSSVRACHLCVGKPSMVLGRLTWKWWSEGHLRCLVEANQKDWSRKASNIQKRANHDISNDIPNKFSHASKNQKMKRANHNKKVHLIISGIHFIWVKNGIQNGIYWSSPS